jgi:glycosyltransferase involved in cell wall biosynthesis
MADDELTVWLLSGPLRARGRCDNLLRLCRHLPEHGAAVRLLCSDASRLTSAVKTSLQVHEVPFLGTPFWRWLSLPLLQSQAEESPPDVIHVQSLDVVPAGLRLARSINRPCVLNLVDPLTALPLTPRGLAECDAIITVSDSIRDEVVRRRLYPPERISVIRPGVEPSGGHTAEEVLAENHVPVVGTAGPLEPVKGLPYFLHAAAEVHRKRPDAQFVISGEGGEESGLRRLARSLQIDQQVTFVPPLANFRDAILAMDVFCQPSLQQGFGTVLLQAMSLARPVIATDVGAAHELIRHQQTGLLVPTADAAALASAILFLLERPVEARKIAAAGQDVAQKQFRLETTVEQTLGVYRRLISEWARRQIRVTG